MKCLLCNRSLTCRLTIHDLFWPAPIKQPFICPDCQKSFVHLTGPVCPGCSRLQQSGDLCPECHYWRQKYQWRLHHHALYHYNETMKDYMHRYKFNGDYRLRWVFAAEVRAAVQAASADLIVPVPVTAQTLSSRGFNQVEGLLEGVRLCHCLRAKYQEKAAQSTKNRHQRLLSKQPFVLQKPALVTGRRILLVDDVYTTGRTLYHAASLLYDGGAATVASLSLAR